MDKIETLHSRCTVASPAVYENSLLMAVIIRCSVLSGDDLC